MGVQHRLMYVLNTVNLYFHEINFNLYDVATWQSVTTSGASITPRYGHCSVVLPSTGQSFTIGGVGSGGVGLKDVWSLNLYCKHYLTLLYVFLTYFLFSPVFIIL